LNELIQFIELCLVDGNISEKEKEIIFRKSEDLGVPKDECEVILLGLIQKSELSNQKSVKKRTSNKTSFLDDTKHKKWFLEWLDCEKDILFKTENINKLIQDSIRSNVHFTKKIGIRNEKNGKKGVIMKDTVLKMCDLENIPDIPGSFWKKPVWGKRGRVENTFKEEILKSLNNEKFLCFLSSSISPPVLGMGSITVQWTNNDLNQMIMYYDDSSITSDEGWLKDYKNTYTGISDQRQSLLITDKFIYEFFEETNVDENKMNKINIDDVTISHFSENGSFRELYRPIIKLILESENLSIEKSIPKKIIHDNKKFLEKLNSIKINDYSKRLIKIDDKIERFVNEKFNSQFEKLNYKYFYGFGTQQSILGDLNMKINEFPILDLLNKSLEFFNQYLKILKFRDYLLILLLNDEMVKLEKYMLQLEDSIIGMTQFEKKSLEYLNSIDKSLTDLSKITKDGFENLSNKFDSVISDLNSIEKSNNKILDGISINNLISLVNVYQNHRINKKIVNLDT